MEDNTALLKASYRAMVALPEVMRERDALRDLLRQALPFVEASDNLNLLAAIKNSLQ